MGQEVSKHATKINQDCSCQNKMISKHISSMKIISKFLNPNEVIQLQLVCRSFKKFIEVYFQNIKVYDLIFQQLQSDDMAIQQYRKDQYRILLDQTDCHNWTKLHSKIQNIYLTANKSQEISFQELLMSSEMQQCKLRRENVGIYTKTSFQEMLSMVLQVEQKGTNPYLIYEYKAIRNIQQNKINLLQELKHKLQDNINLKELFIQIRWNIFENKTNHQKSSQYLSCRQSVEKIEQFDQDSELAPPPQLKCLKSQQKLSQVILNQLSQNFIQENHQHSNILTFIKILEDYIVVITQSIAQVLGEFTKLDDVNTYDILNEYILYWHMFSNIVLEISESFAPLQELINESYDQIFPNCPQYPRFSFWRAYVKLWHKHVYINVKQVLQESFARILKYRRAENLLIQFKDLDMQNGDGFAPDPFENISHELYDNFIKNKQISKYYYESYNLVVDHPIIKGEMTDSILRRTFQSIQDISLNEITIHWYGHSDAIFDEPFNQLSDQIIKDSCVFYSKNKIIFHQNDDLYLEFLQADLNFMSNVTSSPMVCSLRQVQKDLVFTSISHLFEQQMLLKLHDTKYSIELWDLVQNNDQDELTQQQINTQLQEPIQIDEFNDEIQQLFLLMMNNPDTRAEDIILEQRKKNNPDPLFHLVEVTLKQNWNIFKQSLEPKFMNTSINLQESPQVKVFSRKISRSFSRMIDNSKSIPKKLVDLIVQISKEYDEVNTAFKTLRIFYDQYEKESIHQVIIDEQIEAVNLEHQIPKQLTGQAVQFYSVVYQLRLEQIMQLNSLHNGLAFDRKSSLISLSKASSKIQRGQSQFEEYNSEDNI